MIKANNQTTSQKKTSTSPGEPWYLKMKDAGED